MIDTRHAGAMVLLALLVLGAATQAGADVRVLSATLNRVDDGAPAATMAPFGNPPAHGR